MMSPLPRLHPTHDATPVSTRDNDLLDWGLFMPGLAPVLEELQGLRNERAELTNRVEELEQLAKADGAAAAAVAASSSAAKTALAAAQIALSNLTTALNE